MRAAVIEKFGKPLALRDVPDPAADEDGVVLHVEATGLCLSDWHGWMGHDADITLPHVPGHELAGTVEEVGKNVVNWKLGDRVTLPFVCGCGKCELCQSGQHQICDHQFQPGFTAWGSFAPFVAIKYADNNLVRLPEEIDSVTAASLGCRFATSFRAVTAQGRVAPGQWVAVHGSGGVGLSATMIARAMGANVIAVDLNPDALKLALSVGASNTVNAGEVTSVVDAIKEISQGGAHVSIDALGSLETCVNSVRCLRKRGRHVQVGLMVDDYRCPPIPMDEVVAKELEIRGSHGMQAYKYGEMLRMVASKILNPTKLISKTITLAQSLDALVNMGQFRNAGVTVIDRFDS